MSAGGCSHHDHGASGHVCGATPGTGVTQTMDEMKFQRGVWGAVMDGDLTKLKAELVKRKQEVFETDPSGFTPLHYASRAGKTSIVRALLEAGALPDARTKSQEATALQRAAYMGHTSTVEALLEGGATIDLQDSEGSTALHKASAQSHAAVVKYLISKGANVSLKDSKDRTAREVATSDSVQSLFPAA